MKMYSQKKCTDVMSFCMQFEKIGSGLLREALRSKGGALLAKREGEIKKYRSWKTEVNLGVLPVIKKQMQEIKLRLFNKSTHILSFQTACGMTSHLCVLLDDSPQKTIVYYLYPARITKTLN